MKKLTRDTQITYRDLDIFVYREGIQRYPRHLRKIRRGKSLGWGQYLVSTDITSCLSANLVPRAFPLKNTHFLREKPWGRGCLGAAIPRHSPRKHPFLLALWGRFAWNVPSYEERGETDVFAGYRRHWDTQITRTPPPLLAREQALLLWRAKRAPGGGEYSHTLPIRVCAA